MPFAAGIKFSKDDFSVYYNPGDIKLEVDSFCHVRDHRYNLDRIGFVSILEGRAPIQMEHLPKVGRLANETEIEVWYENQIREREGRATARRRAREHSLDIKISSVTFVTERQQVLIHFTSEKRIDFRALVRDLAGDFKSRIEMWQIGARQEAGTLSGMGVCGRELCCSSWLTEFPSVSMRHAKDQGIVQPPSKLSGPCNRLRCCLRYEHEVYLQIADDVPPVGCKGGCAFGTSARIEGTVVERRLIRGEVVIEKGDGERVTVNAADFLPDPRQSPAARRRGAEPVTATIPDDEPDGVVLDEEPEKPIRPHRNRDRSPARERDSGTGTKGSHEAASPAPEDGPADRGRGNRGASGGSSRGGRGGRRGPGAGPQGGRGAESPPARGDHRGKKDPGREANRDAGRDAGGADDKKGQAPSPGRGRRRRGGHRGK